MLRSGRRIAMWGTGREAEVDAPLRGALETAGFEVQPGAGVPGGTGDGGAVGACRQLVLLDTDPVGADAVCHGLADPPAVSLVLKPAANQAMIAHWAETIAVHDAYWSLTTATALAMPAPSRAFVAAVMAHLGERGSESLAMGMETALHETFVNALLHGNLGLPSMESFDAPDPAAAFYEAMRARLEDPALANRRVELLATFGRAAMTVAVRDSGPGLPEHCWDQTAIQGVERTTATLRQCGRGLELTAMFCDDMALSPDGRTVSLTFLLSPAARAVG